MLKPLNPQKIYAALDEIYSRLRTINSHAFIFQSARQKLIIESDRILYLESITTDHRAKLILTDGKVEEISLSGTNFIVPFFTISIAGSASGFIFTNH